MGVIGVRAQVARDRVGQHQPALEERVEELELPPAVAEQRVLQAHLPGAGPDQQALVQGGVDMAGVAGQVDVRRGIDVGDGLGDPVHEPRAQRLERTGRPEQQQQQRRREERVKEAAARLQGPAVGTEREQDGHRHGGAYPRGTRQAAHQHADVGEEGQAVEPALGRAAGPHQQRSRQRHHQYDVSGDEVGIAERGDRAVAVGVDQPGPDQLDVEILQDAVERRYRPGGQRQMQDVLLSAPADQRPGGREAGPPEQQAVRVQQPVEQPFAGRRGAQEREQEPQPAPDQDEDQPASGPRLLPLPGERHAGGKVEDGHHVHEEEDPRLQPLRGHGWTEERGMPEPGERERGQVDQGQRRQRARGRRARQQPGPALQRPVDEEGRRAEQREVEDDYLQVIRVAGQPGEEQQRRHEEGRRQQRGEEAALDRELFFRGLHLRYFRAWGTGVLPRTIPRLRRACS